MESVTSGSSGHGSGMSAAPARARRHLAPAAAGDAAEQGAPRPP